MSEDQATPQNLHDHALELHQRLLDGDPVASSELVERLLEPLVKQLQKRAGYNWKEDLIHDAAIDALMDYIQHPRKYDSSKSALLTYLTMAARGDLLNLADREKRRTHKNVPLGDVDYFTPDWNNPIEEVESSLDWQMSLSPEQREALNRELQKQFPDPVDQQLLALVLDEERSTAAYAEVLGISHLDTKTQQRIVKQHKDRIKQRLRRMKERLREHRQD